MKVVLLLSLTWALAQGCGPELESAKAKTAPEKRDQGEGFTLMHDILVLLFIACYAVHQIHLIPIA